MGTFDQKVVVITGGSSGIGLALAEAFGAEGARVVISGRRADALETAVTQLKGRNFQVTGIPSDVAVEDDCRKLIEQTVAIYGGVDILINNAGISMRALFNKAQLSVIRQLMEINFFGTVYCTKYALPHILQRKGTIVGISSIAGYRGLPGRTGYSASKFAMQGFLEALRTELLGTGVRVLVACPGFTASGIREAALLADGTHQGTTPRDEEAMMPASEVAQAILQAIQRRKRTLILTTQGKLTVFLNKWLPAWMDKMVYRHFEKEEGGF